MSELSFKVYSGPHNGSVFNLKPGRYTVGSGYDNDLIFFDAQMEENCAVFNVSEQNVVIEIKGKLSENGTPVEKSDYTWNSGTFITIGETSMYFRSSDIRGEWPLPIPAISGIQTKPEENKEEAKTEEGESQEEEKPEETASAPTPVAAAEEQSKSPFDGIPVKSTAIAAGLLLLLIFSLLFGHLLFNYGGKGSNIDLLNEMIKREGFTNIKVVEDEDNDNNLIIDGFVSSRAEFAKLIRSLPQITNTTTLNVSVRDDEIVGLENDFAALGFLVHAHYIENDDIAVDAYIKDAFIQAEAFNAMEKKYRKRLRGKIAYRHEVESTLRNECSRLGLGQVPIIMGKGRVYYNLRTTLEQENALEEARFKTAEALKIPLSFTRYDPKMNLSVERMESADTVDVDKETAKENAKEANIVQQSSVSAQKFDETAVQSVTLRPMRFVTFKNGRKFFEGGVLPSGFTVSKIDLNKIILTRDKEVKELTLK